MNEKQKSFTKTGYQIYDELKSVYPEEFAVLKLKKYVDVDSLVAELHRLKISPVVFTNHQGWNSAIDKVLLLLVVKETKQ